MEDDLEVDQQIAQLDIALQQADTDKDRLRIIGQIAAIKNGKIGEDYSCAK